MTSTIQQTTRQKFYFQVAPGVWGCKDIFVNIYMVQDSSTGNWVLVDTGIKTTAAKIKKMAADLFGENSKPKAIILTHGHFDHIGSVEALAAEWHVPVYAHYLEMPYLTGHSSYPPHDSTVGGGLMSAMAFLYRTKPINISSHVTSLPDDHTVPFLPGWQWIHTPGHTAGHVSLFREEDKVLIAGDAFVTTQAESGISTALQTKKISGPPKYATTDWVSAYESVRKLLLLQPDVAAAGHGKPMSGMELLRELYDLYEHFDEVAIPNQGRYLIEPAVADANGVLYVPPRADNNMKEIVAVGAVAAVAAALLIIWSKNKKKKRRWVV